MEPMKVELSLESFKQTVQDILESEIRREIKSNETHAILSDTIKSVFKKDWGSNRKSQIEQQIDNAVDMSVRIATTNAIDNSDFNSRIEKIVLDCLDDDEFLTELAKCKVKQMLNY